MKELIKALNKNSSERTKLLTKISQAVFNEVLQKSKTIKDLHENALKEFREFDKIDLSKEERDEIIFLTKTLVNDYINKLKLPVKTDS
ncbi:hypothetical protein ACR9FY_02470 [Streptococcus dysgalactiae subsp. equisimilis]|uniref:hypothetical protein n=1 Tax=Streptococcus dysgalactiae TaxID=1334 RepID=UPI003FD87150